MTSYERMSGIINFSLDELRVITRYLHEREDTDNPTTVLIGGWAVDSYNPWYGSVDIDLITNNSTRNSLNYYLRKERDFVPYRLPGQPRSVKKVTKAGSVIIDFATREKPFPFEGNDEYLDFSILDGNTETRAIRGNIEMAVPNRATLIVLKLKAVWDRNTRISQRKSYDVEWESGKLAKDYADILALIDPNNGGNDVEISVLGKLMNTYPFLKESLASVGESDDGIEKYGRMPESTAKMIIGQILSLI